MTVTSAAVHDAVASLHLAEQLNRTNYPRLKKVWVDSKYHNHALYAHIKDHVDGSWELEVVSRPAGQKGWVRLPRRWVVERTFAWLGRYRINSKEDERRTASSESQVSISSIQLLLKRLKPSKESTEFQYRRQVAGNLPKQALRGFPDFSPGTASPGRGGLSVLEGHEDFVSFVRYHPGGEVLASVSNDRTVRFWDTSRGREIEGRLEFRTAV